MDYMAQNALTNCCLINLDDMLQNGTRINGIKIDPQHRISTAVTVATQIITAVASSQYGGTTITLAHLAPFVRKSWHEHYNKYVARNLTEEQCHQFADEDLKKEVKDAVQTFNYQINSMSTTNGQAPFLSVVMWVGENPEYETENAMLIEEFLKQRIIGMKNEKGVYITPAFPKLLYILDTNNITENAPYWYLTKLAAQCTAKRMVPDYISAKKMREYKINRFGQGDVYGCMGCRSFLTPDRCTENYAKALNYDSMHGKYYGRFNMGVTTINLVDLALSSKGDLRTFWNLFEQRTELCHKGLRARIDRLLNVTSDVAPILWQDGAFARLGKGESLTDLIHHGYSTTSLGYAGLYECVKYMTGHSHTDGAEGEAFGLEVMKALNDKCNQWKQEEDIDYSLYGSPIESTTYKFAQAVKKRFGDDVFIKLDGKDRNYITNSYHVPVFEKISPFDKLEIESKFQKLSPGGAISYIECADLTQNINAVLTVIQFIYDHIMYAELNTKSDYCQECGYEGEILIDDNNEWYCPNCGNRNHDTMNVARRTCGYIGAHFWNYGRTNEIKDRYVHLGGEEVI
jgi:ribonucleoside-triphosphate reductase